MVKCCKNQAHNCLISDVDKIYRKRTIYVIVEHQITPSDSQNTVLSFGELYVIPNDDGCNVACFRGIRISPESSVIIHPQNGN